eukprot:gb/GEZN01003466.1/.p1 GENE.gb/GEZN01003466.1/~~gb/GEZN01003466.1/.p1  ORF type:complete len:636 (+),score=64.11 gb/GEZN01003466.1/:110-2017(+)
MQADYVRLGEVESPRFVNPMRAAVGSAFGMFLVGAHLAKKHLFSSSQQESHVHTPYQPNEGLDAVLVRPGLPSGAALVPPPLVEPCSVFLYSQVPKEVTDGATVEQGKVYGAFLPTREGVLAAAFPTGSLGHVIKGDLLKWPTATVHSKLNALDKIHGYDSAHPHKEKVRRGVISVVRKDGTSVKAFWYYQVPSSPTPADQPLTPPHARYMAAKMRQIYGDPESYGFPQPNREAGTSSIPHEASSSLGVMISQRRYLWTDAFGVLNYCTLAINAGVGTMEGQDFVEAAKKLIQTTHQVLGSPPNAEVPMLKLSRAATLLYAQLGSGSLSKYAGLRIGKELALPTSDPGMELDGMYWHYIDKWLYALVRFSQVSRDPRYLIDAALIIKEVHPYFMVYRDSKPWAIRWKTNCDLTPIPKLFPLPSSDSLSACVVCNIINSHLKSQELAVRKDLHIDTECAEMRQAVDVLLNQVGLTPTGDPLGFGLQFWKLQWLEGKAAQDLRDGLVSVQSQAINRMHFGLPFRLYGALLGGKLSAVQKVRESADALVEVALDRERLRAHEQAAISSGKSTTKNNILASAHKPDDLPLGEAWDTDHWSINTVMLLACLDTWAWQAQLENTMVRGLPGVVGCETMLKV